MSYSRPNLGADNQKIYRDEPRSSDVLSEMHKFYQDERFCDIVLCVEGRTFACHRLVLAASSLYFERMFSNGMSEANAREVQISDVMPDAIKYLVQFAYTSELIVTKETALDIFEAADMLQFPTARAFCQDFLADQICADNCLHFMLYADAYSCEPLYDKAKICAAKHFKVISPTADFINLPGSHVCAILKEDNIEMEYEEHVYEALRSWVLHDRANREKFVPELFSCIRLNFVSRWYLIEVICRDDLITSSEDAMKMLQRAKDQMLAQGHTYEIPWQLPPSRKCTGMTEKIVYLDTHDPNPAESELFLFDVVNKSWSSTSHPCPLASAMSTCEASCGSLYVIGGWNHNVAVLNQKGAVNTIHEFKTMTIFPTLWYVGAHTMGVSRYLHGSVAVGNRLYIFGGYDDSQVLQDSMMVTDPDKRFIFEHCPKMIHPISRPAVSYHDNHIYVFGGFYEDGTVFPIIQVYNVIHEKWGELSPISDDQIYAYQYVTCIGGIFYLLCCDGRKCENTPLDTNVGHVIPLKLFDRILTYNPLPHQWKEVYRFPEDRSGDFCVTTLNHKIYMTGGMKGGQPYNVVECFDPATNAVHVVGNSRDGCLSLCATMTVMHENFGL